MSARLLKANLCPTFRNGGHQRITLGNSLRDITLGPVQTAVETVGLDFDKLGKKLTAELPATMRLLTDGGDARIVCGPHGANRYGCSAVPEPDVLAYGSSTASTISDAGFAAADALRKRLKSVSTTEEPHVTYERELDRVRHELTSLCGLEELPGLEIIFGASGTDLHLFASQLMVDTVEPRPLIVRVEASETGSGVPDALAGRHFSDCAALGDVVIPNVPLDCGRPIDIQEVKCRTSDGRLRPASAIDAEVAEVVIRSATAGRRVLLTLVDVSKTGLLAPSPHCVDALHQRFPELVEVLVDACQFRLAPSTLKAYLEHDFVVAITGSKFITGPTFCGALLVPQKAAQRLKARKLPRTLKSYSASADWPRHWAARSALNPVANYGLLLRWEAAMTELRAFRQLPETAVADFLDAFAKAVTKHLSHDPAFELVPVPVLDRSAITPEISWDRFPTIFSFLLMRRTASGEKVWLTQSETKKVHELLREDLRKLSGAKSNSLLSLRCQIGQPVPCGTRDGIPVSALRLCASTRAIVDALSPEGRGSLAVIIEAIAVLNKAALLASLPLA
jgi:hypothetical protein